MGTRPAGFRAFLRAVPTGTFSGNDTPADAAEREPASPDLTELGQRVRRARADLVRDEAELHRAELARVESQHAYQSAVAALDAAVLECKR